MNTDSDIYKMTAKINAARKAGEIWNHPQEERYVTDNFYAFQRGEFLVATTNTGNQQQVTVPNTAFADGTEVCNIFNDSDCQTVSNKSVNVTLQNGESKIYVPKSKLVKEDKDLTVTFEELEAFLL